MQIHIFHAGGIAFALRRQMSVAKFIGKIAGCLCAGLKGIGGKILYFVNYRGAFLYSGVLNISCFVGSFLRHIGSLLLEIGSLFLCCGQSIGGFIFYNIHLCLRCHFCRFGTDFCSNLRCSCRCTGYRLIFTGFIHNNKFFSFKYSLKTKTLPLPDSSLI